jgi:DNA polymerase bacteriophage-type
MRLNYSNSRPMAFIDFETQARVPITTSHAYTSHPDTYVLCAVVKTPERGYEHFGPYLNETSWRRLAEIGATHTMVAHNATFDSQVWDRVARLPPTEWFDTLPCARAAGFPGGINAIGQILTGRGKDPNGSRLIELLCDIKQRPIPVVGNAHKLLIDYCGRDVELLEAVYDRVKTFGEPDVIQFDRDVNDRGIPIDRRKLHVLIDLYNLNDRLRQAEFDRYDFNPRSPKQVKDWLREQGFQLDGVGLLHVRRFMERPEDYFVGDGDMDAMFEAVQNMLDARRQLVRVGKGKAEAALEVLEDDDRIREQLVYWGAHTGRWTSRKFQLHNMPRPIDRLPTVDMPWEWDHVVDHAEKATKQVGRRVTPVDVLNSLLRHLVHEDNLIVPDYMAVEARGTAWIADDETLLDIYRDPTRSPYMELGERVFGHRPTKNTTEYVLSKILVLGCTYGMSGAKFEASCRLRGTDVRKFLDPKEAVATYRSTFPRIPQAWSACHQALHDAVGRGTEVHAVKCVFRMRGPDLQIVLPSGRPMTYRNARIEPRVPAYCAIYNMPLEPVPTVIYDKPNKGMTSYLYGSKGIENIVQGTCRDLLVHAMLSEESAGMPVILHVHDEQVGRAPDSRFEEFMEIMSTPPKWAEGFPLGIEGYSGPVWTKNPPESYRQATYQNGRNVHA